MPVTNYVWDEEADSVLMETDGSNVTEAVYTNEPVHFGNLVSQRRGSTTNYCHFDALGSTRQLTDGAEAVTDTFTYDAWGNEAIRTGTTILPFQWIGALGYYYDDQNKGHYVRARVYDPTVARWWSIDAMVFLSDWHGFRYVWNRPISFLDPSGQQVDEIVVEKEVPCPYKDAECGCRGDDCVFQISAKFRLQANGGIAELCFMQGPGAEAPDPPGRTSGTCTPEIDRTQNPKDHFTITLSDGTECKFTSDIMPPNRPFPPDWEKLPKSCRGIIELDPVTRCYRTTKPVTSILVNFTIDVSCGCVVMVDGEPHRIVAEDTITLNGKLPKKKKQ